VKLGIALFTKILYDIGNKLHLSINQTCRKNFKKKGGKNDAVRPERKRPGVGRICPVTSFNRAGFGYSSYGFWK
jgi:hypothetical protein